MSWLRDIARRSRGPLIWAMVTIVLIVALRNRAWQHVATLNGDEWQVVQTFLRPNRSGDEPICFLPSWTTGHATDQYKFRGIDLLVEPSDAWEGRDEPLPGFWVVSQFDVFDAESVPEEIYPHRTQVRLGQAQVHLFRREPFELPRTLATRLDEAECVLDGPGEARLEMVWNRTGWSVPRSHSSASKMRYLGCRVTESRFGGRPHYGIWFHPPPPGQSLTVTWPEIELEEWVGVNGGLRDHIAGRKAPPVKLSVSLDGRTLGTLTFPAQRGWKSYSFRTGFEQEEGPRKGRLAFKTWAKNNHSRHLVFDAVMSKSRPAGSLPPRKGSKVSRNKRSRRDDEENPDNVTPPDAGNDTGRADEGEEDNSGEGE